MNNECIAESNLAKTQDNPALRKSLKLYLNIFLSLCAMVNVWIDVQSISAPRKEEARTKLVNSIRKAMYNVIELRMGFRPEKLLADGKGVDEAMRRLGYGEAAKN